MSANGRFCQKPSGAASSISCWCQGAGPDPAHPMLQIPISFRQRFRGEAYHRSETSPATIPIIVRRRAEIASTGCSRGPSTRHEGSIVTDKERLGLSHTSVQRIWQAHGHKPMRRGCGG